MFRPVAVAVSSVALLALTACAAPVDPAPAHTHTARELATALLTAEDYGDSWTLLPDEQGTGGGPVLENQDDADPCTWATDWLPDAAAFSTQAWRVYRGADGNSNVSDWIVAAAPGVDLRETLAAFEAGVESCGGTGVSPQNGGAELVFETGILPSMGDASFSYRADFLSGGSKYGEGEVHVVVCGDLWVNLSYSGWDPFVERDRLLPILLERAAALGGCTA